MRLNAERIESVQQLCGAFLQLCLRVAHRPFGPVEQIEGRRQVRRNVTVLHRTGDLRFDLFFCRGERRLARLFLLPQLRLNRRIVLRRRCTAGNRLGGGLRHRIFLGCLSPVHQTVDVRESGGGLGFRRPLRHHLAQPLLTLNRAAGVFPFLFVAGEFLRLLRCRRCAAQQALRFLRLCFGALGLFHRLGRALLFFLRLVDIPQRGVFERQLACRLRSLLRLGRFFLPSARRDGHVVLFEILQIVFLLNQLDQLTEQSPRRLMQGGKDAHQQKE